MLHKGLDAFLDECDVPLLQSFCSELGLDENGAKEVRIKALHRLGFA